MENPLIFVADADPKNLNILRDSLESSGFSVMVAEDGLQAWEKIQSEQPDLILSEVNLPNLDGFQLLEKLKEDSRTSIIPMMFLTNRRDIEDRVRSLRGGVKDYMIKPLHVKEVIARIRMILRRFERVKSEDSEASKKMVGRLEEYSLVELIDSLGSERKTGVLNIYNEQNRNGEIWFKNGAVVHASFGTLKSEKAVYQMLPWRHGHFIMTIKDIRVSETINVSNLGLLLHGYKRMEQREQLFKQLPSPETTFVLSEAFRKVISRKEFSQEASKFIALIDGRRNIMRILDEGVYDDIQSLERLVKLYKEGFIKPGKALDHTSTEINIADPSGMNEIENLQDQAQEEIIFEEEQNDYVDKFAPDSIENSISTTQNSNLSNEAFPPPDFDALDNEDMEKETFEQNEDFQFETSKLPLKKEEKLTKTDIIKNEMEDPKTEELSNQTDEYVLHNLTFQNKTKKDTLEPAPNENDIFKSSPNQNLQNDRHAQYQNSIPGQVEQEKKEKKLPLDSLKRDEIMTDDFENEIDEQNHDYFLGYVPDPLMNAEFSPDTDILKALHEEKIETPEKSKDELVLSDGQPDLQESPHEISEDFEQEAIVEYTNKVQVPASESKKSTYSFPLRSYGKPRIENKQAPVQQPKDQTHADSKHEDSFENGIIRDKADNFKQPSKQAANPNKDVKKSQPPKLQQTQKSEININISQPPSKRIAQKSFTDLDHLFQRQHALEEQKQKQDQNQDQETDFSAKTEDHVSMTKNTLLVDYFTKNQLDHPKFVLIGSNKKFITAFATFLLDGKTLKESKSAIFEYFAAEESRLDNSKTFSVIGMTMEKQFTHLLDKVAASLAGYILLIDASDKTKLEYVSYLYKALQEKFNRPCGIVIYDGNNGRNFALDTIKDLIGARADDLIMKIKIHHKQDHLRFLREMLNE